MIDKIEKVKVDKEQIEPFLPYIYDKLNSLDREELIKHFVSAEFNRYLSYYKYSKDINIDVTQEESGGRRRRNRKRFFNRKNNRNNNRKNNKNRKRYRRRSK